MTEIAITENSAALLDAALDAAGGLERWREHSFLSAHLSQGGGLWRMKAGHRDGSNGKGVTGQSLDSDLAVLRWGWRSR
jgi:hypothetical protein